MNAVITLAIGDYGRQLLELSGPAMKRYADTIGAALIAVTETKIKAPEHVIQVWPCSADKFQLIDYLGRFDRLFFLDADILLTPACPDIFGEVGENSIGWSIHPETGQHQTVIAMMRKYGYGGAFDVKLDGSVANGGMLVCSRRHREVLNMAKLIYLGYQWNNEEQAVHFSCRSLWQDIVCLHAQHNVFFYDYPEFDRLPAQHIHKRIVDQYAQRGINLHIAWKDAYSVHYSIPSEFGGIKRRCELMLEGRKYFYGR